MLLLRRAVTAYEHPILSLLSPLMAQRHCQRPVRKYQRCMSFVQPVASTSTAQPSTSDLQQPIVSQHKPRTSPRYKKAAITLVRLSPALPCHCLMLLCTTDTECRRAIKSTLTRRYTAIDSSRSEEQRLRGHVVQSRICHQASSIR